MKTKKVIYVLSWAVLMFILSFILHAGIEIWYLNWLQSRNLSPRWVEVLGGGICALPLWLIYLLPIVFIALGVWWGFFFWQKVYVEHLLKHKNL